MNKQETDKKDGVKSDGNQATIKTRSEWDLLLTEVILHYVVGLGFSRNGSETDN